jgi:hypothetical protein
MASTGRSTFGAICGVNFVERRTSFRGCSFTKAPTMRSDAPIPYTVAVSQRAGVERQPAWNTGRSASASRLLPNT